MKFLVLATLLLPALAVAQATQGPAATPCVAIIGTGDVGSALGTVWARAGIPVVYGSRSPQSERVMELVARTGPNARAATPAAAAQACPRLLFAVPWTGAEASIQSLGPLAGKVILDASNPLTFRGGEEVALAADPSGAEQLQRWAAGATVVKAFNTLNWRVMADPQSMGGPVSVPLSGNDAAAKAMAAELVRLTGNLPVDVGPLRTARHTEAMALLYVGMSARGAPHEFILRPRPTRRP